MTFTFLINVTSMFKKVPPLVVLSHKYNYLTNVANIFGVLALNLTSFFVNG